MAEIYLLCDDRQACILELAEVERILGVSVCSRSKENMKRQAKLMNHPHEKSTIEIILRDNSDDKCLLGASPILPRQLYNLPSWLIHSWEGCNCIPCKSNPTKLAMAVYKFFAYHGAALQMTAGKTV